MTPGFAATSWMLLESVCAGTGRIPGWSDEGRYGVRPPVIEKGKGTPAKIVPVVGLTVSTAEVFGLPCAPPPPHEVSKRAAIRAKRALARDVSERNFTIDSPLLWARVSQFLQN